MMFNRKKWQRKYRKLARLNNRCSAHPNEKKGDCEICKNNRKERYLRLKKLKKCVNHPLRDVVNDKTMCVLCLNKGIENNKKRKNYGIKNGMCRNHSNRKVVSGKTMCKECLWKLILRTKRIHITDKIATKILKKQNYRCPLSNIKLVKGINASPDHIKHKCNGGTCKNGNIRFVDTWVNQMRSNKTDKQLIEICKKIYLNSKRKR